MVGPVENVRREFLQDPHMLFSFAKPSGFGNGLFLCLFLTWPHVLGYSSNKTHRESTIGKHWEHN